MNINKLSLADVGRWIVYTDSFSGKTEKGRLKSWNDKTIFVVFKCGEDWNNFLNYTGQGCSPTDIRFESVSPIESWLGGK